MKINLYKLDGELYEVALSLCKNKAELITQRDKKKIISIKESVDFLHQACNLHIKTSSENDKLIERWKELKWKSFKFGQEVQERLTLLEQRRQLYQNVELPDTPSFPQLLSKIVEEYPHLRADLENFEQLLKSVIRLEQSSSLTEGEIARLRSFLNTLEQMEQLKNSDLKACVTRLLDTINAAFVTKKQLLNELIVQSPHPKPFAEWDVNSKISFLAQAAQILNNPFEPRFNPEELLRDHPFLLSLVLNEVSDSKKRQYWDWMPPLERQAFELADTPEKKQLLIAAKTEGLKKLALPMNAHDASHHLVVGAGPAGLIHALCFQLLGKKFQIIEKRKEDKTPRQNTVTLGKWERKELEILLFLGAIHRLENKISFGHNRPYYNEVALGDLEDALLDIVKELNHGINPIHYETMVSSIDKDSKAETSCTLFNFPKKESILIKPSSVIIADGVNGNTKQLLGIDRLSLAKPTLIHFSIFEPPQPLEKSWLSALEYVVVSVARACLLAFKMLGLFFYYGKSFEETYALAIDGGPAGLSRLPAHDYLIRVLKKGEQDFIEQTFQKKLKWLQLKKKKHEKDQQKLQAVMQKRSKLIQQRENYLTERAQSKYGMLDFLHMLFRPQGHTMRWTPLKHKRNFLVDILISQAERTQVKVGNCAFLIRGDACHTTDPYSGTGCKTALEETIVDQYFLRHLSAKNVSEMELAILNWGQSHYQDKMIDKAFEERFMYYTGTENALRFIELAKKYALIDEEQGRSYLQLCKKKKYGLPLTEGDLQFKAQLIDSLVQKLEASMHKPKPVFVNDGWKMIEATVTQAEWDLFKQAAQALIENHTFPKYSKDIIDQLKTIAAKLCCHADERGPLLYLLL